MVMQRKVPSNGQFEEQGEPKNKTKNKRNKNKKNKNNGNPCCPLLSDV